MMFAYNYAYVLITYQYLKGFLCSMGARHPQPQSDSAYVGACVNYLYVTCLSLWPCGFFFFLQVQTSQHDEIHLWCSVTRCHIISKTGEGSLWPWLIWCEAMRVVIFHGFCCRFGWLYLRARGCRASWSRNSFFFFPQFNCLASWGVPCLIVFCNSSINNALFFGGCNREENVQTFLNGLFRKRLARLVG